MRSSSDGTIKTFATLRFRGDELNPGEVTQILRILPTLAYLKGQSFKVGERAGTETGKTGLWYFSTDKVIAGQNLHDHLMGLFSVIALDHFEELLKEARRPRAPGPVKTTYALRLMGRLAKLSSLIHRNSLVGTLTCFWYGEHGAKLPIIPRVVSMTLREVPINIETDFMTEEHHPRAEPLRA